MLCAASNKRFTSLQPHAPRSLPGLCMLPGQLSGANSLGFSNQLAVDPNHATRTAAASGRASAAGAPGVPGAGPAAMPSPSLSSACFSTDAARAAGFSRMPAPEVTGVATTVHGQLPPWLNGCLLRNGAGVLDNFEHMFDSLSCLLALDVSGRTNTVTASSRLLQSSAFQHYQRTGALHWREFGSCIPASHPVDRLREAAGMVLGVFGIGQSATDNASVDVVRMGPHMVAMTETRFGAFVVDPGTLSSVRRLQYTDGLRLGDATTAHPNRLPNGDTLNIFYSMGMPGSGYTLTRQPAADPLCREPVAFVPHRNPLAASWVHSFPSSEHYSVLPEMPMTFNLWALLTSGTTDNVVFDWRPDNGTLLHVISHDTGEVRTFEAPPFAGMHWVNAFESPDGRFLHMDGCLYDDLQFINDFRLSALRADADHAHDFAECTYRRITIDLEASSSKQAVAMESLVDDPRAYGPFAEMPRINPTYRTSPYRFAYALSGVHPFNYSNSFVKLDNETRTAQVLEQFGALCSEAIFVPAPGATEEDQGAVIATVVQPDGFTALVCIDGQSFEEIARAVLPFSMPIGFHGNWLSEDELKSLEASP